MLGDPETPIPVFTSWRNLLRETETSSTAIPSTERLGTCSWWSGLEAEVGNVKDYSIAAWTHTIDWFGKCGCPSSAVFSPPFLFWSLPLSLIYWRCGCPSCQPGRWRTFWSRWCYPASSTGSKTGTPPPTPFPCTPGSTLGSLSWVGSSMCLWYTYSCQAVCFPLNFCVVLRVQWLLSCTTVGVQQPSPEFLYCSQLCICGLISIPL